MGEREGLNVADSQSQLFSKCPRQPEEEMEWGGASSFGWRTEAVGRAWLARCAAARLVAARIPADDDDAAAENVEEGGWEGGWEDAAGEGADGAWEGGSGEAWEGAEEAVEEEPEEEEAEEEEAGRSEPLSAELSAFFRQTLAHRSERSAGAEGRAARGEWFLRDEELVGPDEAGRAAKASVRAPSQSDAAVRRANAEALYGARADEVLCKEAALRAHVLLLHQRHSIALWPNIPLNPASLRSAPDPQP